LAGGAYAQTVTLPAYEDTTLQGGAYENTNFGNGDLVTRASSDATWVRRGLLKFDTHNIPEGATVTSATLTLTVKGGNSATRTLTAYCEPQSFWEHEATWRRRSDTLYWSAPGGTAAHVHDTATATAVVGSKVAFNATSLVQEALDRSSARYTRVLVADMGAGSRDSLRYFYSNEASTASLRPSLVVTYSTGSTAPVTSTTSSKLRVFQWNIASTTNVTGVADFIAKFKPDVVSLNQIYKYSSDNRPQKICDLLEARLGGTWYYHWAQKWGATSGEGEAVLSRFPIADTESRYLAYDRSAALVRILVNGRIVNVVSTHLDHQYSSKRLAQVKELKSWLSGFAEQRIVAGDFNSWPGTTEINEMGETYYDAWAVAKSKGTATSTSDNTSGATRNTRIDYVWYSKGATKLTLLSAQTTEKISLSDHRGVLAVFQVN
jgi:endonuclease/exonuclease/phosphatase family metal-dependent hydrolase